MFASHGYSIGLISRKPIPVAFAGAPNVAYVKGDGGDPASLLAALDELVGTVGAPSLVVYNISGLYLGMKPLDELTWEEMSTHMTCSVVSGLAVGQWAAKHLIEAAEGEKKLKSVSVLFLQSVTQIEP